MYKEFIETIEEFDTITIYRHEHPDCDAFGSQFGLKQWLNDNYPSKKVYALGLENSSDAFFPTCDVVSDEIIQSSLAIVLDCGNVDRVDDKRFVQAKKVMKVDHHPNLEPFGQVVLVDDKMAATCELLMTFFLEAKGTVSLECATHLYRGLLTDTLCFRTTNTTSHTLYIASKLSEKGLNIPLINRELFDKSYKQFQFASYIRSQVQVREGKLAYIIVDKNSQEKYGVTANESRNYTDEIGHVKEFQVWCIFSEKTENGVTLYDGSLRSKEIAVNKIANGFNGGGHKNASGVKNLTKDMLEDLLNQLMSAL